MICITNYLSHHLLREEVIQDAKVVNQQEVREILADYFKVPKESVINSKYSFIIIGYTDTTNNLKEAKK